VASFADKLRDTSRRMDSLVCVGLDVQPALLPSPVLQRLDPVLSFNKAIIDATSDLVCAYKPNLAFYEALGPRGWEILAETVKYIPEGIIKIADAKRGDIGNTAQAYAKALFDVYGFDAVTVNPYLGHDSVQPFLDYEDKGAFVLCKTSNKGSGDFQNLSIVEPNQQNSTARPLFEQVATSVVNWNTKGNCGLVVGATYPQEIARARQLAANLPILVPGVGAQGGDLEAAVRGGMDHHQEMLLVNSSRAIIYASHGDDFAMAARKATLALRDAINKARRQHR
jgi:orotidine-5'-phosphate decarboxylase